jgi:uncharacterized delta-60 repeat protein
MCRVRQRPLLTTLRFTLPLLAFVVAGDPLAPLAAQVPCSPLSTAPGSLDTCFGLNGYVLDDVTGSGAFQAPTVVKAQPDGRLIVGGYSRQAGATGTEQFLLRLNPDGTLDTSFGVDGIVKTHLSSSTTRTERVQDLAVLPDGKIVVLSQVPGAQNGPYTFGVVRYNSDGSRDSSFGANGAVTFGFEKNLNAWAQSLAVLPVPPGTVPKLLVSGHSSRENSSLIALARLNSNGMFDPTFDGDGKATISVGRNTRPGVDSMVLDSQGRAMIVGSLHPDGLVLRVTTAGGLDTTFNGKGWATLDFAGGGDYLTSVAIDGNGRIVAGGRADLSAAGTGARTEMGVVRYLENGSLDSTFGSGGKVTLDINDTLNVVHGLALQGDGRIVVAGEVTQLDYSTSDTVVARFNTNGSLDDGSLSDVTVGDQFGTGGMTVTDFSGAQDYAAGLTLQPDGNGQKVVALSNVGGSRSVGLTRYFP